LFVDPASRRSVWQREVLEAGCLEFFFSPEERGWIGNLTADQIKAYRRDGRDRYRSSMATGRPHRLFAMLRKSLRGSSSFLSCVCDLARPDNSNRSTSNHWHHGLWPQAWLRSGCRQHRTVPREPARHRLDQYFAPRKGLRRVDAHDSQRSYLLYFTSAQN